VRRGAIDELSESVFYDSASPIGWGDLNQTLFLEGIFSGGPAGQR
jgi:hypothetical protein